MRPAVQKDLAGIEHVARITWVETYSGAVAEHDIQSFLDANYSHEALERRLRAQGPGLLVAAAEREVVGFASVGRNQDDDVELFAIYVLPGHQRSGVGRALMGNVRARARELGVDAFLLWVLSSNDQAARFYEATGGRRIRERSIEIGTSTIDESCFEFQTDPSGPVS